MATHIPTVYVCLILNTTQTRIPTFSLSNHHLHHWTNYEYHIQWFCHAVEVEVSPYQQVRPSRSIPGLMMRKIYLMQPRGEVVDFFTFYKFTWCCTFISELWPIILGNTRACEHIATRNKGMTHWYSITSDLPSPHKGCVWLLRPSKTRLNLV
jgi:hypothetical protein